MESMNKIVEEILVNFKSKGDSELEKELNKLLKKLEKLDKEKVKLNKFEKGINKLNAAFIEFNGNMLSLLFFGMEMNRVFTGALKSIFESYKKLIPEQSEFNILTTRLAANWEFFKFQLADVFANSDFFKVLIQYAINLVQWFQQLSPKTKEIVVQFMLWGAVIGFLLEKIAVMWLGLSSLYNILKVMGAAKIWGLFSNLAKLSFAVLIGDFKSVKEILTQIGVLKAWNKFKDLAKIAFDGVITGLKKIGEIITTKMLPPLKTFLLRWGGFIALLVITSYLWKKFVDRYLADVGLMADDWYDYVTMFVVSFAGGYEKIGSTFFATLMQMAHYLTNFVKFAKNALLAIFDPDYTVKDAWQEFLDDAQKIYKEGWGIQFNKYMFNMVDDVTTDIFSRILKRVPQQMSVDIPTKSLNEILDVGGPKYYTPVSQQQPTQQIFILQNKDELRNSLGDDVYYFIEDVLGYNNLRKPGY